MMQTTDSMQNQTLHNPSAHFTHALQPDPDEIVILYSTANVIVFNKIGKMLFGPCDCNGIDLQPASSPNL